LLLIPFPTPYTSAPRVGKSWFTPVRHINCPSNDYGYPNSHIDPTLVQRPSSTALKRLV
jgi:hypothetical protein